MKCTHLLTALCCAMSLVSCGEKKQTDLFDYSDPVDLSATLQAYDWYQHYEGDNKDSILYTKMKLELPEDEFYLFEDTAFVLRVPEYANSKQPFLANAEDFYNSCALSWNVWSNYEVWYRGHTADLLRYDDEVKNSIKAVSVNIIKDNEYRKMCYVSCLKRIENHPDDIYAMNCAAAIGGRTNMNRFGQNYFGNEAMIERAMMMPNRYPSSDDSDEESDDEE